MTKLNLLPFQKTNFSEGTQGFNSGKYKVKKDKWKDVNLEIYYHEDHEYNLERMMVGIKASLAYNSDNFSPYQHKQVRIIEFPRTGGGFAQSFKHRNGSQLLFNVNMHRAGNAHTTQ